MKFVKYTLLSAIAFLAVSCSDNTGFDWSDNLELTAYSPKVGK